MGIRIKYKLKQPLSFKLFISISSALICFIISLPSYSIETMRQIQEDKAAKLFILKCSGCHTVGGGALVGPDLKRASTFQPNDLLRAILRMQEQVGPLGKEETDELAKFLKDGTASERIEQENQRIAKLQEASLELPDARTGRELFLGIKLFKNNGLSCISCHNVAGVGKWGGGKLGPSLENIYRKFGEHNLASAIENCNWKIMREAYKNHPITKQEAIHLTDFFKSIRNEPAREAWMFYLGLSGLGCLFLYIAVALFYKNRLKGVRKKLGKEVK
ncbi:MAG: hypothetical protein A3I68_01930 [Candidatus Melainabacteria bacterium RIFCSPLOWO2_02_FULL_35_15]|nr:MAG: hypothetical protein A3F80_01820 [Candidatus Melainabacteria bacterium RIFCSPLOWO2_12_FULL_35_11]OGI13823.1 MAG: hypothetical protein A3I68_01930 [Candidatus Melainabacteria bacterium RIFCSPLOWO2_02_FULL_35_15]